MTKIYVMIKSTYTNVKKEKHMKFESRIFNNIEYTLVDIYDWKIGEKIYHFASDEDYLFCFKKNENYIVIEEKEKLIKAWKENDRKHEEKLRNKYDVDKIFEESKDKNILTGENSLIDIKESKVFLTRVIERLIEFLKK